jgi:integrase
VLPTFGERQIESITKANIREWVEKLAKGKLRNDRGERIAGGNIAANRALANLRAILLHLEEQSDSYRAPSFRGLTKAEKSRERSLSDTELKIVWRVASETTGLFGKFVQLLLLTAARRNEVSQMIRGEVATVPFKWNGGKQDVTIWTLPASRNKAGVDLVRPLSQMARNVLAELPRIDNCEYFFSTDGETSISSFGRWKRMFDERVTAELRRTDPQAQPLPAWTLHDLRRTSRGLLSQAGVRPDYAEQCLGHLVGGIDGTYNKYDYMKEKAEAFDALAKWIALIVSPPEGDNVRQLRKA